MRYVLYRTDVKLGKTKYTTDSGKMDAQQIIKHQQEAKACKRSRKLRCTYCTMDVQLDGMPVRLLLTDYINRNPTGQMLIRLQPYAQIS